MEHSPKIETIYVLMPEEGVACWSPTRAEHLGEDRYRILEDPPDDDVWEFKKGDVVCCRTKRLHDREYVDAMVAYKLLD